MGGEVGRGVCVWCGGGGACMCVCVWGGGCSFYARFHLNTKLLVPSISMTVIDNVHKKLTLTGISKCYTCMRNAQYHFWLTDTMHASYTIIVQELCESPGGRPGLSVLTSLLVSVDVKIY